MGNWSWSWQGILTSIVGTLLLAGVPSLLTWIKKRWPQHGELVRYWITTAAALAILVYATTGYVLFAKHEVRTTQDNIDASVKVWAENLGLSIVKVSVPDSYFGYTITTVNGNSIQVVRSTKDKPAYLQFVAAVSAPLDQQPLIASLTHDQLELLTDELGVELNKDKIGFNVTNVGIPQTDGKTVTQQLVALQVAVPIDGLTEFDFSKRVDDLDFGAQLVHTETALVLKRMTSAKAVTTGTKTVTQN